MGTDPKGRIFIGYRRDCSFWQAYSVYYFLRWKGRDVFKDIENSKRGNWRSSFDDLIRSSEHFVLILDPSTFQNTSSDDEVLREIKVALRHPKRNIVQIRFDGFELKKHGKTLPQNIFTELAETNAWPIHQKYSVSITSSLNDIEQNALVHKEIPETPIPAETKYHVLSDFAQTVLSKDQPSTKEGMENTLSDSDDFQNISRFVGVSKDEYDEWIHLFMEDLLDGKIDLVNDDLNDLSKRISSTNDIGSRYSDTDDF